MSRAWYAPPIPGSPAQNCREPYGHKKERGEHGIQSRFAAAHSDRHQDHVDSHVSREHTIRLELADYHTPAHAADHEQDEPNAAQPLRGLQAGDSRLILENVVDEKAENADLRRDVEKLRGNAQSEMLAPEHVPVPGDDQECHHVSDDQ